MVRRLCLLILFVLVVAPAAAQTFSPPGLSGEAAAYAQEIRSRAPAQQSEAVRKAALERAQRAGQNGQYQQAVGALEEAIAHGDNRGATWLVLSLAWTSGTLDNVQRAMQAAYQAFVVSRDGAVKRQSLERLAGLFDQRLSQPILALDALETARRFGDLSEAEQSRLVSLRERVGLRLQGTDVQYEGETPTACFTFSYPLAKAESIRFDDFLAVEPAVPLTTKVYDRRLCVTGITHGMVAKVMFRQGLPGEEGVRLNAPLTETVRVPDRSPVAAFRGNAFILPKGSTGGVPLETINLDQVRLTVFRINDRNLIREINAGNVTRTLYEYSARDLAQENGELIWEGTIRITGPRNERVTTAVPVREAIGDLAPGLYVMMGEPEGVSSEFQPWQKATQWLMVSDIGLTSMRGADGIDAFARSFANAEPLEGIELVLVARNNKELGRAVTDSIGRAHFPAGLVRGDGGNRPAALMAYGASDDFAVLDLTRAAFDLSDRGVSGRKTPGPLDAFLYTERGVYRPGETVHVTALLRDDETRAVDRFPLTVKVLRPSGTEFYRGVVPASGAGGHALPIGLTRTAPMGRWTINAYGDPEDDPIGTVTFQVEDFVPERLAVEVAPSVPFLVPEESADAIVDARFLYGPPGAGLGGKAEVSLGPDAQPYSEWRGYRFGLARENTTARLVNLEFPTTDETGRARVPVVLPPLPDTTRPLKAEIRVEVTEPGGRPTRARVEIPVRHQPFQIGIKPGFEGGAIAENGLAAFDLVALDPTGTPVAVQGARYELVAEHHQYQWYFEDGQYNYRTIVSEEQIDDGAIAFASDGPESMEFGPLPYGRYRLEVFHEETGVATSLKFSAGWWVDPSDDDTPDRVLVAADQEVYEPGEQARIRITPPFAGNALVTVLTDRVHSATEVAVPEDGATINVPVSAEWGPGAYITVSLFRPPVEGRDRLPLRAIGLTWVAVDPAARSLNVAIEGPDLVRPRGPASIPVRVAASDGEALGEEVFLTLAAVDEGILRLTGYQSPDPLAHFFGKRSLGIDIRDDYGRLIDTIKGPTGELRQGGDAGGASLPVVPFRVVAMFQGPVKVGPDGLAFVTLDIPDFNGEARLMAVAFGKTRLGSSSRPLTIRDPLVAEMTTPRFLAPGDISTLTLSLHNVEAPAGPVQVAVETQGPLAVEGARFSLALAQGERQTIERPLIANGAGIGDIRLRVEGPDGATIVRDFQITVRPARPVETLFMVRQLEPGATARIEAATLAGYLPGTGALSVTYGSAPPFDVPGLLGALDRFPYGCTEQVISRALPLLYVNDIVMGMGDVASTDEALPARIDRAIGQVLDKQRYDGALGLWSGYGDPEPWLSAYGGEFLVRARMEGQAVPDAPLESLLTWLRSHAIDGPTDPAGLASRAYALHVLALARVATPGPIRYFYHAFGERLPTPLAKAQVAAALARLGYREEAGRVFDEALENLSRDYWQEDYGTTVRDAAALVLLLAEAGLADSRLPTLIDRMPMAEAAVKETNTQEQAWLVVAADALMSRGGGLNLSVTGTSLPQRDPVYLVPTIMELSDGIAVRNLGRQAVWEAVSVKGVPLEARPAAREGLAIKRYFFNRDGTPLNLDAIRQNDVFVMVLEGESNTGVYHQAIAVHPMPAGWEIENSNLGASGTGDLPWLKDLTTPRSVQARDDRFVAAVDLSSSSPRFKLAFLVRAVTPGTYELPGGHLEDMYKPRFFARQAPGRIAVLPAGEHEGP